VTVDEPGHDSTPSEPAAETEPTDTPPSDAPPEATSPSDQPGEATPASDQPGEAIPPGEPGEATPPTEEPADATTSRLGGRRRLLVLGASGLLVLVSAVVILLSMQSGEDPAPADPRLDTWAPYWALDDSRPGLDARAGAIDQLSPFWYSVSGVDEIGLDPNAPADATAEYLDHARRTGVRIVPSVVDALPAGEMASILGDPTTRSRHVDALVALADDIDADGLDIDYERFAFADDRSTWPTTRPAWVAFVTELAERLHADGRTLSVSIPPVYDDGRTEDSGYWVYDYAAIAPVVDRIRVMAYDYSTSSPGPIAPLDWVDRAIEGTASASGDPSKLVLGLPVYGYNWAVATTGTCPDGQAEGRTGVTDRSATDLATRRGGVPVFDEVTGEWSFTYALELTDGTTTCTQQRTVHYVDAAGALARLERALDAGFAGGSLWAFGYETDTFWDGLGPLMNPPEESAG
jgi:spore germination protein YaaH